MFRLAAVASVAQTKTTEAVEEKVLVKESATLQPMKWWGHAIIVAFMLFFALLFLRMVFPEQWKIFAEFICGLLQHFLGENVSQMCGLWLANPNAVSNQNLFIRSVNAFSLLSIPFLLSLFPLYAALRRVKVYEEFVDGAKEGFDVAIRIIPYLVAMLVAVGMFRAAGGIDLLSRLLAPLMNALHFPTDLLPMVLVRPLSGSGSLGFFTELVKQFGPDSLISRMAGTIYGSTETTFYVLAVYFGSVAIKRTRHALLAGLTADAVSVITAVIVCKIVFG